MDASKIVSSLQKISKNNPNYTGRNNWIWRVEATNQRLQKTDGSFFIGSSEETTPYFEGRGAKHVTYAEAKAAMDAAIAEVLAMPEAE